MKINVENVTKVAGTVAGATCAATGIVALSALVASGAAVGAVVEGFRTAGDTMKKLLSDETENDTVADGQSNEESIVEGGSLL